MLTYLERDRKVLEYLGNLAGYASLHRYVGSVGRVFDSPSVLL